MSRLQFEDNTQPAYRLRQSSGGAVTNLMIKYSFGIIKNTSQARIVQLVIVVVGLFYTFFTFTNSGSETTVNLTPEQIDQAGSEVYRR